MNEEILQQAGLTKSEAQIYTILVQNSPCPPPKLANLSGESRTNTYKLLDSLEEKGLVSRDETQKKLRYWANNPANLLESLKKQRADVESAEKRFQDSLPTMIDEYFKYSDQPSVRYFHGVDGIRKVFEDQLADGNDLILVHSRGVIDAMGADESHILRNEFPKRNIHRRMLYQDRTPRLPEGEPTMSIKESDRLMKTTRTWIQEGDLKEPVEWAVYGDKLSVVSLGNELMGMIIESPQIAASFKEIYDLLDRKIHAEPGYEMRPLHNLRTLIPEAAKKH
jgi:sugar-specific transcriptional regulator TrmB